MDIHNGASETDVMSSQDYPSDNAHLDTDNPLLDISSGCSDVFENAVDSEPTSGNDASHNDERVRHVVELDIDDTAESETDAEDSTDGASKHVEEEGAANSAGRSSRFFNGCIKVQEDCNDFTKNNINQYGALPRVVRFKFNSSH